MPEYGSVSTIGGSPACTSGILAPSATYLVTLTRFRSARRRRPVPAPNGPLVRSTSVRPVHALRFGPTLISQRRLCGPLAPASGSSGARSNLARATSAISAPELQPTDWQMGYLLKPTPRTVNPTHKDLNSTLSPCRSTLFD